MRALYDLLVAEHGYLGSYKAVARYVRRRRRPPKMRPIRRVEVAPGSQAQVDWVTPVVHVCELGGPTRLSDRVAVMYVGRIIESAETEALFGTPRHPYTRSLLDAAPVPNPSRGPGDFVEGEVADPANPPSGCAFHPRCPFAETRCRAEMPELRQVEDGRWTSCHRAEELDLRGSRGGPACRRR